MNIVKNRKIYFIISGILFVISLLLLFVGKLNLWIDMTGWINLDYSFTKDLDIEKVKKSLEAEKKNILNNKEQVINDVSAYTVTWEKTLSVVAWFVNSLDEKTLDEKKWEFRGRALEILKKYDNSIEETKYTNIGKSFWDYIKDTAFFTLAIAILAISFYIYYAFSGTVSGISPVYFGLITLLALFHDVIISSGFYIMTSKVFSEFQIDTFFVTALLTILGYSINDTIVVFDRLRWNLKKFGGKKWKKWKKLDEIVNLSINETIVRSLYTSLTLIFVLLTIFFFWPETLRGFILVMIFGTFVGTYSSIFIAAPLLYELNKNKKLEVYKKKEIKAEDKIVV